MNSEANENGAGGANSPLPLTGLMLIGGELVESSDGKWLECINPASEEYIGKVPAATNEDVQKAVTAAQEAQIGWRELSIKERAGYLLKLTEELLKQAEDILVVEVADTGNTISPMRLDLVNGVERMKYFMGLGYEMKGHSIPSTPNNYHFTVREPYGVVARIVAFNHPIYFALCGIAAPLMAGNSVILKPSEQSPLSASMMAEIASRILPAGVLTILSGIGPSVGEALVKHPGIKRVSFVGSARTGMAIQRAAAESAVKHVTLELGGKNPFLVFPDADLDQVADAAVKGMNFGWQGQSCGSTSRLLIHKDVYDEVLAKVVEKVRAIRVGDPFDENSQMGPINSAGHFQKVNYYIKAGLDEGAKLECGGNRPKGPEFEKGYWVEPTVFSDVNAEMKIAREEIFGPVLSVLKCEDEDDLVRVANDVEYGLTAAVWTQNISRAMRTVKRLQAGYVWVNGVGAHVGGMPYGGFKNSGTGRERGIEELISYTEEKAIHIMI